jgi:hypothetical protein
MPDLAQRRESESSRRLEIICVEPVDAAECKMSVKSGKVAELSVLGEKKEN